MVPSPTDEEERFWVPRPFSQPHALSQPYLYGPWAWQSPEWSVSSSVRLQGQTGLTESLRLGIGPDCR